MVCYTLAQCTAAQLMLLMQVVDAATALTSIVLNIEHMHAGIASHGVQV